MGGIAAVIVAQALIVAVPATAVASTAIAVSDSVGVASPALAIESPAAGASLVRGSLGDVTLSAAHAAPLDRLTIDLYDVNGTFIGAVGSTSATASIGAHTWIGSYALPADLAAGSYTISATVTDAAGSARTVTSGFDVTEHEPPSLEWLSELVARVVAGVFASLGR
ncbi:hypothetical protein [Microbacterium sp. NPDC055357]